MSNSVLISGLVASAEPVRPRRIWLEVLTIVAVAAIQLYGISHFYDQAAMARYFDNDTPRMILKFSLFGLSAVAFTTLALWSLSPTAKRAWPWAMGILSVVILTAMIGFDRNMGASFGQTFMPQFGRSCVTSILALSLPVTLVLTMLMGRGASVQPNKSAILIGLAGGTWGAFTYALQCPFVGLYYLGLWYFSGVALVTVAARLILPRLNRW